MKNKQIYHIRKTFPSFLSNAEKLEKYRNSNLTNSKRPSFGDDINVTFIS